MPELDRGNHVEKRGNILGPSDLIQLLGQHFRLLPVQGQRQAMMSNLNPREYQMIYRGLSCGRMIWFLDHPLSKLDRRHTGTLKKRDNLQTEERGNEVGEGVPNHMTERKPRPL